MSFRYFIQLLFISVLLVACYSQEGRKGFRKSRNTGHYTQQAYIERKLDNNFVRDFLQQDTGYARYAEDINAFYQQRDFHYAWIGSDGQLTEQAGNFINMMKTDAAYGLNDTTVISQPLRELYDTLLMEDDKMRPDDKSIPRIELLLTAQFFAYGNKIWGGMTSETAKDLEWFIPRKKIDMQSLLDSMVSQPASAFEEPVNQQYTLLREALQKLAELEKTSWSPLSAPRKYYKTGDSNQLILAVKERLYLLGDLTVPDSSQKFNAPLDSAVRNFQDRMGLEVDGVVQPSFLSALSVTPQKRIQQILINMERLRWVYAELPSEYLLVNIPAFKLYVYDNGKLDWSCKVVVGKPGTNTVVFNNKVKYIVFSPYWNVPPGILKNEVLPAIRRNRRYLASQNMEMVSVGGKVTVRQRPGGENALGKVKFVFPNEYNIYLHDTPAKGLFEQNKRSFSHGCIRVEEPQRLAEWLLRKDSSWTKQKIVDAMNAGKERIVTLKDQVPVYIGYFTAFVDSKGRLNFRDDVYGHDARLAVSLFGGKRELQ
jgi:murein L,D-transpeptidase YcbB/YkuD